MSTFNHANGLLICISAVNHNNVVSVGLALIYFPGRLFRYLLPFLSSEIVVGRATATFTLHPGTQYGTISLPSDKATQYGPLCDKVSTAEFVACAHTVFTGTMLRCPFDLHDRNDRLTVCTAR